MKIAPLILVVVDHELLRVGLRSMLQSMELGDAQIAEAGSLKEAIEIYEQNADSIRLVILDLNLPDSKGLSALQAFKQRFPRSRVVILSGSVDEAIAEEARVLGAEQFLHKAGNLRLIGKVLQALPTLEGRGESAEGQGIATKLGAASTGGVRLSRQWSCGFSCWRGYYNQTTKLHAHFLNILV